MGERHVPVDMAASIRGWTRPSSPLPDNQKDVQVGDETEREPILTKGLNELTFVCKRLLFPTDNVGLGGESEQAIILFISFLKTAGHAKRRTVAA
jgi:hypothetical protein